MRKRGKSFILCMVIAVMAISCVGTGNKTATEENPSRCNFSIPDDWEEYYDKSFQMYYSPDFHLLDFTESSRMMNAQNTQSRISRDIMFVKDGAATDGLNADSPFVRVFCTLIDGEEDIFWKATESPSQIEKEVGKSFMRETLYQIILNSSKGSDGETRLISPKSKDDVQYTWENISGNNVVHTTYQRSREFNKAGIVSCDVYLYGNNRQGMRIVTACLDEDKEEAQEKYFKVMLGSFNWTKKY